MGFFCGTNRGILQQYHGISPVIVDIMDMWYVFNTAIKKGMFKNEAVDGMGYPIFRQTQTSDFK